MKKKWQLAFGALALAIPLSLSILGKTVHADVNEDGSVDINKTNFPDDAFREEVAKRDYDHDSVLSEQELENFTYLSVAGSEDLPGQIKSLKGIEYLSSLTDIYCNFNQITTLDLTKNPGLESVHCVGNGLKKIILDNPNLDYLDCGGNLLTGIDISKCPKLSWFYCGENKLTSIDISKNKDLEGMSVSGNAIKSLDLSKNKKLQFLACESNKLTTIDVSMCPDFFGLVCANNQISKLDLSNNPELCKLFCENNKLTELDLSKNMKIIHVECFNNAITEIDVANHKELEELYCQNNKITSLNASGCSLLANLYCQENEISSFSVYGCSKLKELRCYGNQIPKMNLSKCAKLEELVCSDNKLQTLDLSVCSNLKNLGCSNNELTSLILPSTSSVSMIACDQNQLTSLNVNSSIFLQYLDCSNNQISDLNINSSIALVGLWCSNNQITNLNLKGRQTLQGLFCNKNALTSLNLEGCTALTEINCNENKLSSLDVSASGDLEKLSCNDNVLTSLKLGSLSKLYSLSCKNNKLSSLSITALSALRSVDCSGNRLSTLNVDGLSHLESLSCNDNKLTKIDVAKTGMKWLYCADNEISTIVLPDPSGDYGVSVLQCDNNKLTSIDLSKQSRMETLTCSGNQLTEIKFGKNARIEYLDISNNLLKTLSVGNYAKLEFLECYGNQLKKLDLSKNEILLGHIKEYGLKHDVETDHYICEKTVSESEKTGSGVLGNMAPYLEIDVSTKLQPDSIAPTPTPTSTPTPTATPTPKPTVTPTPGNSTPTPTRKPGTTPTPTVKPGPSPTQGPTPTQGAQPTPLPPVNMPDVVGMNYEEAQEKITKTVKPHGFDEVIFKIEWVDNDDPEKDLTVLQQDPEAGKSLSGNHSTLDVTLYVAGEASDPGKDPTFEDFVERLYTVALNRASEPEGKAFWVKQVVEEGKTGADCARFFLLDADEFMKRGLSVEDFVETLYATFFDRESDPAGKQGWVDAIKSGKMTRADVVNNFIESTEWCDVCATYGVKSGALYHKATKASKNSINFATRLYTCCLKRDPEEDGIKYWSLALTNLEQTGASAAQFFFEGPEFIGYNTTEREYLMRLYTTFMDREPSEEEISFWIGEIAGGRQTRHSILAFFAQSPEFTGICKQYGIDRGVIE